MNFKRNALTTAILATSLTSGVAMAQDPNPYMRPDDTWISINGTVQDITRNSFGLNYGDGVVIVEMDDGDRDADAYKLSEGDEVTVNGLIDNDFFETTSIEASSVYVPKLNTHFYASARDEEDYPGWYSFDPEPGEVVAQGIVTEINGDKFTINNNSQSLRVNTYYMENSPLDNQGYHRIDIGDVVQVSGDLEFGFFATAELDAESIVTLSSS